MAAQPQMVGFSVSHFQKFRSQALAISRCIAGAGRTVRPLLPKRQIVTHDPDPLFAKSRSQSDQERSVAVRSRAVSEQ